MVTGEMLDVTIAVSFDGKTARRQVAPSPSDAHGRDLFDEPRPMQYSRQIFQVLSTTTRSPATATVRVVKRNCFVEVFQNGQVVEQRAVFDDPVDFKVVMWRKKGMTDSHGFRITKLLETDPVTGQSDWRILPPQFCFEAIFEGLYDPNDEAAAMGGAVVMMDEPVAVLPFQRGRRPLIRATWRAEHPIGSRFVTEWERARRKYLLARVQVVRDKMRKGQWYMCVEDPPGKEEAWKEVSEDAMPALEREMKEEKDSGRHLERVVARYGMDNRGVVPTPSAYCTPEQAFNVPQAYLRSPGPKKGRAGVWDNVNGIDRANKCLLDAIGSVQETLCSIKDLSRLIEKASSKVKPELQAELLTARKSVTDTNAYIEAKFQASFGSKVIKKDIPCFVRKDDSIKSPPTAFHLHFCVEGTVVGVDAETRATIIAVGDERKPYHLPDHRVHFNRKDAEEGALKRQR